MLKMSLLLILSAAEENLSRFHFSDLTDQQYQVINDSVMGGKSSAQLKPGKEGLRFTGTVTLENNGGFASVRKSWPLAEQASSHPGVIALTVTGDGGTYQFRLRTNRGLDGAAYSQRFRTLKNTRQTVYLPVADFVPVFRGRVLSDMPALRLEEVQQMGILIADEQAGAFALTLHELAVK